MLRHHCDSLRQQVFFRCWINLCWNILCFEHKWLKDRKDIITKSINYTTTVSTVFGLNIRATDDKEACPPLRNWEATSIASGRDDFTVDDVVETSIDWKYDLNASARPGVNGKPVVRHPHHVIISLIPMNPCQSTEVAKQPKAQDRFTNKHALMARMLSNGHRCIAIWIFSKRS